MIDILQLISPCPKIRVVDVGAMTSEQADIYAPLVDAGVASVIGFECVEAECAKRNATSAGGAHTFLPYAIGDGSEGDFHECNFPMTSSFYPPNSELLARFQSLEELTRVVKTTRLQTRRLDDLPECAGADFLKLDVQGAELRVIRGAPRVLAEAVIVHTEVEFVPMYRGQPLFADVDIALRELGFSFHRFHSFGGRTFRPLVINHDLGAALSQALWADAIYVRDFMALDRVAPEKLLKMAVILHQIYGSIDLVHVVLTAYDRQMGTQLADLYYVGVITPTA